MTMQRIMLYYRKYLHVELIGPQVCSSVETAIALLRFSEIASKSRDCRVSSVATLQLQKYKRDYMERYLESVSNANETRKKCAWLRAKKEDGEGGEGDDLVVCNSYPGQRPRNTVCGMDYASAKSNKLILPE